MQMSQVWALRLVGKQLQGGWPTAVRCAIHSAGDAGVSLSGKAHAQSTVGHCILTWAGIQLTAMAATKIILPLFILISYSTLSVVTLECYVCKDQDHNKGKCVRTVKTCESGQDRCLTEVRWGGMKYWAPSGEKQYYISKRCASKDNCTAERDKYATRCERIWFNDWECVDCCHGDRCNYFVTLDGSWIRPTLASLAIPLVVYFIPVFNRL